LNSDVTRRARQALFAATTATLAALIALPPLLSFRVDILSFTPLLVLGAINLAFLPYVAWRRMERMRSALEVSAIGLLLTLPGLVMSYAAMRLGAPLADDLLIAADRAIGFDWPAFVALVDRSPGLSRFLAHAYGSFAAQLFFLPVLLCLIGLEGRAYRMMLAYLILFATSVVIGTGFPSIGAYEGHGLAGGELAHVNAHFGYFFLDSFEAVRAQPDFVLALDNAAGIVTFPSVHAGVALLCAWAAWPNLWLRWPLIVLNAGMAVAAITHGAHYLVDILAGMLVASAAISATWLITRSPVPSHRCGSRPESLAAA
jgi:membrane-associated phospholipid phosphatase